MKNKYVREIRRIVANNSLRNKPTGYSIDSKSLIFKIICDLIRRNLIVCNKSDGQFLFVSPADILKTYFRKSETENRITPVPALNRNLIGNDRTENLRFKFPVIIAA